MIGQTLAHYKILEKIGSGGMGDVYLAEDTKLDRKVALKVLPPELAQSEDRRARFKREAKAIAALNHPNIVHVYSVEEADGVHFITMELVKGKTLTELLPKHGFPLNRFFDIAIPLADAVAAAHQEGITHRDLKPDNAMVSDDGRVKVLDFGLARPVGGFTGSEGPTAAKTEEGTIVGTVAYMSPEQAQGKAVDSRSDIFSLGIVFYEMLTGERPFSGETGAAVLSSILKDEPPRVAEVNPDVPREVARIVQRCMAKELGRRLQSAIDLRNDLEDVKEALGSGELHGPARPQRGSIVNRGLAAAAALLLLAVVGWIVSRSRSPEATVPRLTNPIQLTSAVEWEDYPTWSADGQRVAYASNQSGNWDIWMTQLGGGEAVNLTSDHVGDDRYPSWSPDGRRIAFLSQRANTWGVYTVSALGGSPRQWLALPSEDTLPRGAPWWSSDGAELGIGVRDGDQNFADIVTLRTQEQRRVPLPQHGGNLALDVSWSPDGGSIAFVSAIAYVAEITQLWLVPASGGEPTPVTDGTTNDWNPTWSADGTNLFFVSNRGGAMDLWQQSIGTSGEPKGAAQPLTTGLGIRTAVFSPDATKLAYSRGRSVSNVWRVPILQDRRATWADAEPITFDNARAEFVDIAPDGKVLISSDRAGNQDLWVLGSERGEMRQLTFDPVLQAGPSVSPDGTEIAFYAYESGSREIMVMPIDGGPARTLASHPAEDAVPHWSPDGSQIAFISRRSGNRDIWIVDAAGGDARQLTMDPADDLAPVFSPDGRWILFNSARAGAVHLWRIPVAGGEPERFSDGPGFQASFSPGSKVVYFTAWGSERAGSLWAKSLADGREYPVTELVGRPGELGFDLDTDGRYLYFTWVDELGDIWVMDVVQ